LVRCELISATWSKSQYLYNRGQGRCSRSRRWGTELPLNVDSRSRWHCRGSFRGKFRREPAEFMCPPIHRSHFSGCNNSSNLPPTRSPTLVPTRPIDSSELNLSPGTLVYDMDCRIGNRFQLGQYPLYILLP
jgi:hypothetical protein